MAGVLSVPPSPFPPVQRIPQDVDLPPIVPAPLVKPTPPANLRPTAEEQQSLFTCVVPDNRWGRLPPPVNLLLFCFFLFLASAVPAQLGSTQDSATAASRS